MRQLQCIVRNTCRTSEDAQGASTFQNTTTPKMKQKRAFELIDKIKM